MRYIPTLTVLKTGTSGGLDDVNMETPLEEEPLDIDSDGRVCPLS